MSVNMICHKCEQEDPTTIRRRQNTAYVHEESNWITVCDTCFEDVEEYWKEMWEQYYGGRL